MRVVLMRLGRWARSRRGGATVVLAISVAVAVTNAHGTEHGLVAFVFALPVAWLAVWLLAGIWAGNTWPATPSWAKPRETSPAYQLREDPNARIILDRGGFLFERRQFFVATGH